MDFLDLQQLDRVPNGCSKSFSHHEFSKNDHSSSASELAEEQRQKGLQRRRERENILRELRLAPYGTSVTRASLYILYAVRDIFRRPYEEISALSGTTCIIIAESAKQIHSVFLSVRACFEKGQVAADSDHDLGNATRIPSYLLNCQL